MLTLQVNTVYAGVETNAQLELKDIELYERSTYIIHRTPNGWVVQFLFDSGEMRNPLGLATHSMEFNGKPVVRGIKKLFPGNIVMTRVDLGSIISLYTREVTVLQVS